MFTHRVGSWLIIVAAMTIGTGFVAAAAEPPSEDPVTSASVVEETSSDSSTTVPTSTDVPVSSTPATSIEAEPATSSIEPVESTEVEVESSNLELPTPSTSTLEEIQPIAEESSPSSEVPTATTTIPSPTDLTVSSAIATPQTASLQPTSLTPVPSPITPPIHAWGLSARAGSEVALVSWMAPAYGSAPTSYVVQRSRDARTWTVIGSVPASTTFYRASGLQNGVTYYFRVVTRNSAGSGVPSWWTSATPRSDAPLLPSHPWSVTSAASSGGARLSWNAPQRLSE